MHTLSEKLIQKCTVLLQMKMYTTKIYKPFFYSTKFICAHRKKHTKTTYLQLKLYMYNQNKNKKYKETNYVPNQTIQNIQLTICIKNSLLTNFYLVVLHRMMEIINLNNDRTIIAQ
jgi:hypothetical protein